jgi:transcriptional regulator with XRE-family HTH domain
MLKAAAKRQGKLSEKTPPKAYVAMMKAFRKNTRILRERHGWTTRQLAAEADISQAWVYYIERTEKPISFAQMVNVADALGVPLTAMLVDAFDDPKPRKAS